MPAQTMAVCLGMMAVIQATPARVILHKAPLAAQSATDATSTTEAATARPSAPSDGLRSLAEGIDIRANFSF
jgi:hypothetical protein